MMGRKAARNM